MPQQSVRPDILRRWKDELLAWDGDPSTADALLMRLEQITVGHGVSLDRYRQVETPDADWRTERPINPSPELSSVREQLRDARDQLDRP